MLTILLLGAGFAGGFYFNRIVEAMKAAKWFTDLKG